LWPDPPGQTIWWCSRCGMSWRAAKVGPTRPHGCAPAETPKVSPEQLVIVKRSPEYQALRSAGLLGAGTAIPRFDHNCPGREWGRRY